MGMKLLRTNENKQYKYTLAFPRLSDESEGAVIELTYNGELSNMTLGNAYGHIAIGVEYLCNM